MKLIIEREQLLKPLQMIIGVVERRQTLPILSNVLMVVHSHQLSLTASDLEVELSARHVLREPAQAGRITVAGRKLMDICRSLAEDALIELNFDDKNLLIKSGRSRFNLAVLPAEDFPRVEEEAGLFEFTLTQQDLLKLLSTTHFAMAQQDVRYYLNGLLLQAGRDFIRTVATDGHRLAMRTCQDKQFDDSQQVIIPRKGVMELIKLLGNTEEKLTITVTPSHIKVDANSFTFISKLIDENFPDYETVIPPQGDKVVTIDKDILKRALVRTSILSNEKHRGIRLQLNQNLLKIMANNPEQEEAEEELDINYSEGDLEIGFNVDYLIDVLDVIIDQKVMLSFTDPNSSLLIKAAEEDHALYVIMPMKL